MIKKDNYIFSADVIRLLAILGVVSIHSVNAIYTRLDFFGGMSWWIAFILNALSRISIPLFILLSGYLLLQKESSIEMSLKRIFSRILFPFLFGVILYAWWSNGKMLIGNLNFSLLQKIFIVDVNDLYFLVIIIGLYIAAPFIKAYLDKSTQKQHFFLMIFLLTVGLVEIILQFVFARCGYNNFISRWLPYTGLFVTGYVLGNKKELIHTSKLSFIYVASLAATLSLSYLYYLLASHHIYLFSSKGCLSYYFDDYLSFNVVGMAIPAFLLLLNFPFTYLKANPKLNSLIQSIARASFGIYILHLFILRIFEIYFHLAVDFTKYPLLLVILLKITLGFGISYGITVILSKIPTVRYIVGYT